MLRRDGSAGASEEAAGLVEGGEVEGVGGDLDVGDEVALLVNGELELYPTPVELGGALGSEGASTAIAPLVGSKFLIEGTEFRMRCDVGEGDILTLATILLLKGRP